MNPARCINPFLPFLKPDALHITASQDYPETFGFFR